MKTILLLLLLAFSSNAISDTFDEDKNFKPKDNDVPIVYIPIVIQWFKNSLPDVIWLQKLQKHIPAKQFHIHRYKDYSRFDEHPCEYDIWPEGFVCIPPNPRIVYEEELPELKEIKTIPEPSAIIMIGIGLMFMRKLR